uniref:Uncharacterized protein n=1 Tax=Rhizophora mucronata TaxID=61149 RepID=A0A2P2Q8V2_RHIMU
MQKIVLFTLLMAEEHITGLGVEEGTIPTHFCIWKETKKQFKE